MKGFVGDEGGWFLHGPSRARSRLRCGCQGPGFDGVQGTGCMVDCVFFVLDGESCRFRRGRHWRGGRKPVPAGVRSATRGMEPKGGTPQAPHTGHKMFFYGTFVLPRKRRKKRKKKKTWIYFRDFTLSPSMNWKGTNLWEGFRPCSMEFRRDERPSFARLVQSWRMVVILGHE